MPTSHLNQHSAKAPIMPRPKILLPPSYWIEREEEAKEQAAVTRAPVGPTQVLTPGFLMGLLAVLVLVNLMLVTIFKGGETPAYASAPQVKPAPVTQMETREIQTPYAAPLRMEGVPPASTGLIPAPEASGMVTDQ